MAAQDLSELSTNNADDLTLARLLTAVSQDFQRATHRPDILQASYTESRDSPLRNSLLTSLVKRLLSWTFIGFSPTHPACLTLIVFALFTIPPVDIRCI
jgi:hypothetical protein